LASDESSDSMKKEALNQKKELLWKVKNDLMVRRMTKADNQKGRRKKETSDLVEEYSKSNLWLELEGNGLFCTYCVKYRKK